MSSDDLSFSLTPGVETNIHNPNPANCRFVLTTLGGTRISFPVPAGGSFTITVGTDMTSANFIVESVHDYGPRAVDPDQV